AGAFFLELESAIVEDRMNFVADLVHVSDDNDPLCRIGRRRWKMYDQVSGIVRDRLGPWWEQLRDGGAHILFVLAGAVGLDELTQNALDCGRGLRATGSGRFQQSGRSLRVTLGRGA